MAGRTPKLDRIAPAPIGPGAIAATAGLNAQGRGISDLLDAPVELIEARQESNRRLRMVQTEKEVVKVLQIAQQGYEETPYDENEVPAFNNTFEQLLDDTIGDTDDELLQASFEVLRTRALSEADTWVTGRSFNRLRGIMLSEENDLIKGYQEQSSRMDDPFDRDAKLQSALSVIRTSKVIPENQKIQRMNDTFRERDEMRASRLLQDAPSQLVIETSPDSEELLGLTPQDRAKYNLAGKREERAAEARHNTNLAMEFVNGMTGGEEFSVFDVHRAGFSDPQVEEHVADIVQRQKFGESFVTNKALYSDVYSAIVNGSLNADERDPDIGIVTSESQWIGLIGNGISPGDSSKLSTLLGSVNGSGGSQKETRDRKEIEKTVNAFMKTIDNTRLDMPDPLGIVVSDTFRTEALEYAEEEMAKGTTVRELKDPASPKFIGLLAPKYIDSRTFEDKLDATIVEEGQTLIDAISGMPQRGSVQKKSPRKPGESVADWKARTQ